MIDLGDPYPFSVFVTDASGNAANAGAVTVTITLPDSSTVTFSTGAGTVTNPATGTYTVSPDYVPTLAGRHSIRAAATGANQCAYPDSFDVLPADPGYLFSLADARAILRLPAGDTSGDDLLRSYLGAITLVVEFLCGKQIRQSVTQTYDGGNAGILLPSNLISVDSVIENTVTLTPNQDYTVDLRSCILYRGSPLAVFSFIPGIQNVTVAFTKGKAIIDQNVLLGGELILKHFWQGTQQGNRPQFGQADTSSGQTVNVLGYLIPNVAMSFLKASPALGGFA